MKRFTGVLNAARGDVAARKGRRGVIRFRDTPMEFEEGVVVLSDGWVDVYNAGGSPVSIPSWRITVIEWQD
jgi:hypothetical protein